MLRINGELTAFVDLGECRKWLAFFSMWKAIRRRLIQNWTAQNSQHLNFNSSQWLSEKYYYLPLNLNQ
jgi:hypothetical protein